MPDLVDGVVLRAMARDDIRAVAAVEAACQYTPWRPQQFIECLESGYCCHVLERDGQVVAFQVLSAVLDESHLLNIAVAPAMQRRGLARALLLHGMEWARQQGATGLYLELRRSNSAARHLYEQLGFEEIGFRRDYYRAPAGREDAILMCCLL